ncbi:MAG: hypothetical protein QM484_12805 [Woeseiaceae bacterium]
MQVRRYFNLTKASQLLIFAAILLPMQALSQNRFYVGTSLIAFDYTEFDDKDIFLDGEKGFIPGVILAWSHEKNHYFSEWQGQFNYNQIKYDGQTQSGTPLIATSDAAILDTHFKLGRNFNDDYGRSHALYMGVGYRYWYRNIRPSIDSQGNLVAGLLERYYWQYYLLGYGVKFQASQNTKVGLDFRLTKMVNAKMDVDFLGFKNYDNTQVDLGNKVGARLAVPIEIQMRRNSFFITPYYEIIDIGKSNSVRVTVDGVPINTTIHEPRSETRNVGIEFTWGW